MTRDARGAQSHDALLLSNAHKIFLSDVAHFLNCHSPHFRPVHQVGCKPAVVVVLSHSQSVLGCATGPYHYAECVCVIPV